MRLPKLDPRVTLHGVVAWLIRTVLAIAIVSAAINARYTVLFVSAIALAITFLPAAVERRYKVELPEEFEIALVIFVFASLFLGEIRDWYTRFWWWDIILHATSAITFGIIGFILLYFLHTGGKLKASPILLALFAFCFAVAIGAVWEIVEFTLDASFGMHMQRASLQDTMTDLIVDCAGALITSIAGYFYLKRRTPHLIDRAIRAFVARHPDVFRRQQ